VDAPRLNPVDLPSRGAPRLPRPVTVLGWGAFKIGRNEGIKYPTGYDLPSDEASRNLVHAVVDMGIGVIDTAPAYGVSEARLGAALGARRERVFLSTKVGETFEDGRSTFDFSGPAVERSLMRSLERLRTPRVDAAWVHSDGDDLAILRDGTAVLALETMKRNGSVGCVGFSPKSLEGAMACINHGGIDALMLELHPQDRSMLPAAERAAAEGLGVFVKKPLASGRLDPAQAVPWILGHAAVTCVVVGGLHAERLRATAVLAAACCPSQRPAERR
jgi:aryl-alcohol dehydrogenase-like predicted oxidoreductase